MPDELKPCPWCKSENVEAFPAHASSYAPSVLCHKCGNAVDSEDAIAAWNALPRAPRWVEYDGTEATLPPEGKEVLVEISFPGHSGTVTFRTVAKRTSSIMNGAPWWERPMASPWEVIIGNRWMPWCVPSEPGTWLQMAKDALERK